MKFYVGVTDNDWFKYIEYIRLYDEVQQKLISREYFEEVAAVVDSNKYGNETTIQPWLRQGAFGIMVTDAYHRRCEITGEKHF